MRISAQQQSMGTRTSVDHLIVLKRGPWVPIHHMKPICSSRQQGPAASEAHMARDTVLPLSHGSDKGCKVLMVNPEHAS